MMNPGKTIHADILVIGAGLAGFRAAMAAKEANPKAKILLATLKSAPHGSSFSNIHDRLGIQVCLNQNEENAYVNEALSLAPPGEISKKLVRILAQESREAFDWLKGIGGEIVRDKTGEFLRVNGCFSPNQKRAFLFKDLRELYHTLFKKTLRSGVDIRTGWMSTALVTADKCKPARVIGAVFHQINSQAPETIQVKSDHTILACGGETALFPSRISGAGTAPLALHDWCRSIGLRYTNQTFTQFVWCRAQDFRPWDITCMADRAACYKDGEGQVSSIPPEFIPLFKSRQTHAPVSYGLKDRLIDATLIDHLDSKRCIRVFHPNSGWIDVTLAAQVSNGGILIDENGFTGLEGLYACGECSGGMHGADRIGGAMTLSCLIFGKRAGMAAAIRTN